MEEKLLVNPKLGTSLANNLFKIRLAVKSKGRGKSAGLRVISYLDFQLFSLMKEEDNNIIVYLIAIYDKSEISNISTQELKEYIKKI